jgi:sec-independent protein translocase protein TatA
MPNLGAPELLLVLGVIVLLFGAKKLPEFARSLGKAKGEFKKGLDEGETEKAKADAAPEASEESAPETK